MTENERAARKKKISHAFMWVILLILFLVCAIVGVTQVMVGKKGEVEA